ncbi:MAG: hypothetical protein FWD73_12600 [Polyangiaceae bacterium]|nr:hypothetical protein [Polyangiaceae bacterium]
MNLNTKLTTFTALAIAALGTGVLAVGCSSSSDDSGVVVDQTPGDGTGDNTGTGDTGDTGNTSQTCDVVNQANDIDSAECQVCLEANCCTELTGCFDMAPAVACDLGTAEDGTDLCATANCNDFTACEAKCPDADDPAACDLSCQETVTNLDGSMPIAEAYDAIVTCATTNCKDVCPMAE